MGPKGNPAKYPHGNYEEHDWQRQECARGSQSARSYGTNLEDTKGDGVLKKKSEEEIRGIKRRSEEEMETLRKENAQMKQKLVEKSDIPEAVGDIPRVITQIRTYLRSKVHIKKISGRPQLMP